MEIIELLVWGFAVGAAMVFQWLQKRRQDRERAQRPPASQLPDGLFQPPEPPSAPPPPPGPLEAQDWGRGPAAPGPAPSRSVPALEEVHWGRDAPAPEVPAPVAPLPPRGQHLPVPLSALHATVPATAAAPAFATPPAPARQAWHPTRRTRSAFFRTRADVRHAVVAMTVLGPCRALSPYGTDAAGPAMPPRPARRPR